LFENLVFRNLLNNNTIDDIKFWRTQNKNEVDFVLEYEKQAYEVKVNKEKFDLSKYKLFINKYNDFNLDVIDLDSSIYML